MVAGLVLVWAAFQEPASIARVEIAPEKAEIQVGQTIKMSARVLDQAGKPIPNAKVLWFGGGEGSVDSTGVVKGGYRGYIQVVAMAIVPGTKRVTGEARVRVTPAPASRL